MLNCNRKEKQTQMNIVCIEDLVPKDHILRDIDRAIDFSFIYDEVKELYSADTGRPSIDPVVLFKIVLIQYTFGIRSMRQTIKEIEVNNAYRWFSGYDLLEPIPHFSTFGKNYSRRFADSNIFDGLYKKVINKFPEAEMVGIDSGYKTPWIMKQIFDSGRLPATPYKRPMTKKGFFKKYEYVYDEYFDQYICPNNKLLNYSTTNKDGYREYKSNPEDCKNCPYRENCTESKSFQKVVTRHVWEDYMERAEDVRLSPKGKEIYKLRCETIERVFADAKEKHAMRYTQFRGLARLKMQVLLTFTCMNLKKLAKWKKKSGMPGLFFKYCTKQILKLDEIPKNIYKNAIAA